MKKILLVMVLAIGLLGCEDDGIDCDKLYIQYLEEMTNLNSQLSIGNINTDQYKVGVIRAKEKLGKCEIK